MENRVCVARVHRSPVFTVHTLTNSPQSDSSWLKKSASPTVDFQSTPYAPVEFNEDIQLHPINLVLVQGTADNCKIDDSSKVKDEMQDFRISRKVQCRTKQYIETSPIGRWPVPSLVNVPFFSRSRITVVC